MQKSNSSKEAEFNTGVTLQEKMKILQNVQLILNCRRNMRPITLAEQITYIRCLGTS